LIYSDINFLYWEVTNLLFLNALLSRTLNIPNHKPMAINYTINKPSLTNNDILKKLRVAHKLRNDDIIEILKLVDFEISKGALGDMFRSADHDNYVEAGDQILRNFLNGLIIHLRGPRPKKTDNRS